jgi:hypothetical protein
MQEIIYLVFIVILILIVDELNVEYQKNNEVLI